MTNVDVDREIAIGVMGWPHFDEVTHREPRPYPFCWTWRHRHNTNLCIQRAEGANCFEAWSPSTDLRHCSEAESRLSPDQENEYAFELMQSTHTPQPDTFIYPQALWDALCMARATPAQRAAALLAVLKGGK